MAEDKNTKAWSTPEPSIASETSLFQRCKDLPLIKKALIGTIFCLALLSIIAIPIIISSVGMFIKYPSLVLRIRLKYSKSFQIVALAKC